jgi:hypothetical protein
MDFADLPRAPGAGAGLSWRSRSEDRRTLSPRSRSAPGPDSDNFPRARRLSSAQLLQRVFLVDVVQCPRCAGQMRLIAAIVDRRVVARILAHLGLPARAPPLCPARGDPSVGSDGEIDPA